MSTSAIISRTLNPGTASPRPLKRVVISPAVNLPSPFVSIYQKAVAQPSQLWNTPPLHHSAVQWNRTMSSAGKYKLSQGVTSHLTALNCSVASWRCSGVKPMLINCLRNEREVSFPKLNEQKLWYVFTLLNVYAVFLINGRYMCRHMTRLPLTLPAENVVCACAYGCYDSIGTVIVATWFHNIIVYDWTDRRFIP